jgi:general stress protein 26
MTPEQKEKILTVLRKSKFGVIATNSPLGAPESAVIAVSERPDLCVVFGSFNDTRKNANIARDPSVSMVIRWDDAVTLQIEG